MKTYSIEQLKELALRCPLFDGAPARTRNDLVKFVNWLGERK